MPFPARLSDDAYRTKYFADNAGSQGTFCQFDGKAGKFVRTSDKTELPGGTYTALIDGMQIGWLKFNGEGEPPTEEVGLIYDGYVMPLRNSLGNLDPGEWAEGLNGEPQDPWLHVNRIPFEHCDSGEIFLFSTTSKTGRRAAANLASAYNRTRRSSSQHLVPIVRLETSSFKHRDARIGHVKVPVFAIEKWVPRDSASEPALVEMLNDEVPF
jgi:hypothetical protein